MAVTGAIMIAWLILHMLGNLQIFAGAERLNAYSSLLHHQLNELLWLVRIILIIAVVLHIVAALQLYARSRAARRIAYERQAPQAATFASRTMRWGGLLLLLFIIFHVLHMTTLTIRPAPMTEGNVYANLVNSLRVWWVAAIYVFAMIVLGLHLYHGAWSWLRTLGLQTPRPDPLSRPLATLVAVGLCAGFTLLPVAIFLGWVG